MLEGDVVGLYTGIQVGMYGVRRNGEEIGVILFRVQGLRLTGA